MCLSMSTLSCHFVFYDILQASLQKKIQLQPPEASISDALNMIKTQKKVFYFFVSKEIRPMLQFMLRKKKWAEHESLPKPGSSHHTGT